MTRLSMVSVTAIVALTMGVAGVGAHAETYDTKVTLKTPPGVPMKRGTLRYAGKVKSEADGCVKQRKVFLYRKVMATPEELLGTDKANADGQWYVDYDFNTAGDYYARVVSKSIGNPGHPKTCKADKSNVYVDVT